MTTRSEALAARLEQGARALADFARELTEEEWQTPILPDGRKAGVIVHHVASVYPTEIQLAQAVAAGNAVTGVYPETIDAMNADHARANDSAPRGATLDLLRRNSEAAARAIRSLSDAELDRAVLVSLYSDAPLTSQFVLEDHAVRHSYHHLARIRRSLSEGLRAERAAAGR